MSGCATPAGKIAGAFCDSLTLGACTQTGPFFGNEEDVLAEAIRRQLTDDPALGEGAAICLNEGIPAEVVERDLLHRKVDISCANEMASKYYGCRRAPGSSYPLIRREVLDQIFILCSKEGRGPIQAAGQNRGERGPATLRRAK